ncbi:hypothetical protein V6O07_23225 [Arthrospira platensis SPKY2]
MSCYHDNYKIIKFLTTVDEIINPNLSLSIKFIPDDFNLGELSYISGRIEGINFYKDLFSLFEPNSFEVGFIAQPGIWSKKDIFGIIPDYSNERLFSSDCFVSGEYSSDLNTGCWDMFSHSCTLKEFNSDSPNFCLSEYNLTSINTDCIGYSPILDDYFNFNNTLPTVNNFYLGNYIFHSNNFREYITKNRLYSGNFEGTFYVEAGTTREKFFITYQNLFSNECYTNVRSPMGVLNLYFIDLTGHTLLATFSPDRSLMCKYNEDFYFEDKNHESLLFLGSRAIFHEIRFLQSENILNTSNFIYKDCSVYVSPRTINFRGKRFLYKDDSNQRLLWYSGINDKEGNSYVVDIGFLNNNISGEKEIIYFDHNVPITSNGSFISSREFIGDILVVRLKKIAINNIEVIRIFIYPTDIHLMRTFYNLDSSDYKNDVINLEALSISLIQIMLSGHLQDRECLDRRGFWYLEDYLKKVLIEEFDLLNDLKDTISGSNDYSRYGSIPLRLSILANKNLIYNDSYFPFYSEGIFVENLFEEGCFKDCINLEGSNREVSNRAVAWLLYSLCCFCKTFPSDRNKYLTFISVLSRYLISNIDFKYKLINKGWNHNDIYINSERVDDFPTSTNIVTCLALLKTYDITKDIEYLEVGVDLYEGILNYLLLPEIEICAHSLDVDGVSLDSLLHSLWLFIELNNVPFVEKIINLLIIRLKSNNFNKTYSYVYYENTDLEEKENIYYNSIKINSINYNYELKDLIPFYLSEEDENLLLNDDNYQYTYLAILSYRLNQSLKENNYNQVRPNIINEFKSILDTYDCNNHMFITLLRTDNLNKNLLFGNKLFDIECLEEFNTLITSRKYIYNMLKAAIPTRFGWFSRSALLPSGNLGKLLILFSKVLSPSIVNINRIVERFIINKSKGINIDENGEAIRLPRFEGEDKDKYYTRINKFKILGGSTRQSIIDLLSLYKVNYSLSRNKILAFSSEYLGYFASEFFSDDMETGYLYSEETYDDEFLITDLNLSLNLWHNITEKLGLGVYPSIITSNNFFSCYEQSSVEVFISPPISFIPPFIYSLICSSDCFQVFLIQLDYSYSYPLYINKFSDLDGFYFDISIDPSDTTIDVIIPPNLIKIVMI